MKIKIFSIILMLSYAIGCMSDKIDGYSHEEMASKSIPLEFIASEGIVLPYRIYISNYNVKSPLVVFLHGAGERGNDNERQIDYGMNHIARFVDDNVEDAVIVAPQCPTNMFWKSKEMMIALFEFVTHMKNNRYVDDKRVYITGFSMGGEGTWVFSLRYPDMITSLVPLCGGPLAGTPYDYSEVSNKFKTKNVWAFNYFDDNVVDNTYSRKVISEMWKYNTNTIHYTEMMQGGHTAEMYTNKKLLQWMFGTE